jgi:tRNA(adenine34) deaminase
MPKKFSGQARASVATALRAVGRRAAVKHWTARRAVATTTKMIELRGDESFMREALRLANKAAMAGEVPVGAVVVREGKIIARAYNQVELLKDATAHAEMLVLTQAETAVGDWRLTDCDLYVTKEPCPMCAGALVHTRVRRVIFGCADSTAGAAGSVINLLQMPTLNHRCDITAGVLENECAAILRDFFRERRDRQSEIDHLEAG